MSDGNVHYGLAKRLARMTWRPPIFWMTDEDGRLLFHAAVEPTGPFADAAGVDAFRTAHRLAQLPVLGRCAGDRLVTSYFHWGAHGVRARPVRARLTWADGLVPGLGAHETLAGDGRLCEVSGMTWRLSWPLPCRL